MNGSRSLIDTVCNELAAKKDTLSNAEVVLAPPFPYLSLLATRLESQDCHKTVFVAAQTVSAEGVNGAFTGEVSAAMLHDLAVPWCIVGHSERRSIFAESSESMAKRISFLLDADVKVILCIGETLAERRAGHTNSTLDEQLGHALRNLVSKAGGRLAQCLVVAYEPVWAIGGQEAAKPEQVQEAHAHIRAWLHNNFDTTMAQQTRIIYGGSVNASNCGRLAQLEDVDGFLVGGASLKPQEFINIIQNSISPS